MDNNKNICMLLETDFLYPYPDPRVLKEALSLRKSDYDVSVLCVGNPEMKHEPESIYKSIKTIRFFDKNFDCVGFLKIFNRIITFLKICAYARKMKPNFVHAHDLITLGMGVLIKALTGAILIFDSHEDCPEMWISMHPKKKYMYIFLKYYERLLIIFTNEIIIAEKMYSSKFKKMNRNYTLICNYPDLNLFFPEVNNEKNAFCEQFNISKDGILIFQIGGIGEHRSIFEILEAIHIINNPNIYFCYVGKISPELDLKINKFIEKLEISKQFIRIPGVSYVDLPYYYNISDFTLALLYHTPAYLSSVPTKLYESLAVSKPVITSNTQLLIELFGDTEIAFCVDPYSPEDISKAITILAYDLNLRNKIGDNGLKIANTTYNWRKSETELLNIYARYNS